MPKKCDQLEVIEEEMPNISHFEENVGAYGQFCLFGFKVPDGYKLILKKAGVYSIDDANMKHIKMLFQGHYNDSFTGEYEHDINTELSSGQVVSVFIVSLTHVAGLDMGGWVMFDFKPV